MFLKKGIVPDIEFEKEIYGNIEELFEPARNPAKFIAEIEDRVQELRQKNEESKGQAK